MWSEWWLWAVAALLLAALEVVLPVWVFLGFGLGAAGVALVLLAGGPLAAVLAGSFPAAMAVFAVLSALAWVVLRRAMGVRRGQLKLWDRDINDD